MLKKWRKIVQIVGTTLIVLTYVTVELLNGQTIKEEKNNKISNLAIWPVSSTDKYTAAYKTIVSYSREFIVRKELEDQIHCEAHARPDVKTAGETSKWLHDKKLGIRLLSAYYDRRLRPYHYVRILGLFPRNSSLYCQIWYESNETRSYVTQKAVIQEIWSHNWGVGRVEECENEYPSIVSCLTPPRGGSDVPVPSWVSLVDKDCVGDETFVKITSPPEFPENKNFVVCVKPLHFTGGVNERTLGEWVDINRRLGADKIVIYLSKSSKTNPVMQNGSKRQGLIKKEFETPEFRCPSGTLQQSIWYRRKIEIIVYNDCFYSNLYHTKFVIPLDVDEIIVPKTGNNWFEAFRSHFIGGKLPESAKTFWPENYASFSVRNAYFFSRYPENATLQVSALPNSNRKVPKKLVNVPVPVPLPAEDGRPQRRKSIFDRTVRSFKLSPKTDSVKSFVHVPKTLSVFNHFTFHVLADAARQYVFPQEVFQLNHYRNSCDPLLIDGCHDFLNHITYDNTLENLRKGKPASA